jgi:hypothetical protein
MIHFNIMLPSTPNSSEWSVSFRLCNQHCVRIPSSSNTISINATHFENYKQTIFQIKVLDMELLNAVLNVQT